MLTRRRRAHFASSIASILLIPTASASAQLTTSILTGTQQIGLDAVTNIPGPPLDLTHANDGTDRLFMAGQTTGDVRIFKNGALVTTPFLDVNGSGVTGAGLTLFSGSECGLLGMAFHPNYNVPGAPGYRKFYTYTSEPKGADITGVDFIHDELDGTPGTPANLGNHDSVIREWTVSATNADQISMVAADRREVLRIRQPQSNHNGGCLKFGPDGMLYIALGDGGGGNDDGGAEPDGHTDPSVSPSRPQGNAQDITDYTLYRNNNVLGKILRIDPRDPGTTSASVGPASVNGKYRIPNGNPLMGATAGADEIFAYGLRNPFRISFDRLTGNLYAGDVGQDQREEVDIITNGGNYGWVYWEGSRVNFAEPAGLPDIKPIGEYTHADGQATIGGFVYRGENIPEMKGKYIFGELGWNDPSTPETTSVGRVFYMDAAGGTISQFQYLLNAPTAQLYAFGEDRDGELYAMFANGDVRKILGRQWYLSSGGSWGTGTNWLGATPNGIGAAANFLGRATTVTANINLDGNRTVGSMLFNNNLAGAGISYRIQPGTGGTLTLDNSGSASPASIKVVKGNHEITAPIAINSTAELDISTDGSLNVTGATNIAAGRTLTKINNGAATLRAVTMQPSSTLAVNAGTLNVRSIMGGTSNVNGAGTRLNVSPNGGVTGTSKVAALNITNNGTLNIGNNKFIVENGVVGTFNSGSGNYSGLSGLIQRGYDFGAWDGDGIVTNFAAAAQGLTTVAIATAAQAGYAGGTFSGVSVVGTDVLMMYTYAGDANLDGTIDGGDYGIIDNFVQVPGAFGYANGDFNYDGVIDGGDYGIIDNNMQAQGPPFSTSGAAMSSDITAVPEPAGVGVIAIAVGALAMRRRRRHRLNRRA